MSDDADPHIGLPDLGVIVGIHPQLEIRLEFQSRADIELKIEHDFPRLREGEALDEDARPEGEAARRGFIEPEKPEAGLEDVGSQGVAPKGFLQQLGPIRIERREAVEVMSVIKQVLANVVFKLQRELRKIRELGRLRLRLTPDRPGRRLRRAALLLDDMSQLVRHEFPPSAGVGSELARAEDDIPPEGECSSLNGLRQPGGTRVSVDADMAEVVTKPRVEKRTHGLRQWLATDERLNSVASPARSRARHFPGGRRTACGELWVPHDRVGDAIRLLLVFVVGFSNGEFRLKG